ncbi:MAG: hypothetical protein Nkreftii_002168 [Candidatus Nitrospira kreftii]|uniref:Uncharacterized protein n=1 Tax=Candidatus Nitrospira kreftii TaxID=2652173 RepID=A0A7S8IZS9_9BACT|nr:MAG: hypothetical protein Nkreftii_002168 [Candidatus Nitrospira kreftii]
MVEQVNSEWRVWRETSPEDICNAARSFASGTRCVNVGVLQLWSSQDGCQLTVGKARDVGKRINQKEGDVCVLYATSYYLVPWASAR